MYRDKHTKNIFVGVFPADKLPSINEFKYPMTFIVNSDPSGEPGSHWMAIYINANGYGEFFDSYGKHPSVYSDRFSKFLDRSCKTWLYNKKCLQGIFSTTCGHYCLFYILHRARGVSLRVIVDMFTSNTDYNDDTVNIFIKKRYNFDTPVSDLNFMFNQVSRALLK